MKLLSEEIKVFVLFSLLLVVQTTWMPVRSVMNVVPLFFIPTALFLGVAHHLSLSRGVILSFLVGYLTDFFSGTPMSVHTLIAVSIFMVVRGAGLRLFFRGPFFQVVFTWVVSVLATGSMLALRAIFEPHITQTIIQVASALQYLLGTSLITALMAPIIFFSLRKILGEADLNQETKEHAATI